MEIDSLSGSPRLLVLDPGVSMLHAWEQGSDTASSTIESPSEFSHLGGGDIDGDGDYDIVLSNEDLLSGGAALSLFENQGDVWTIGLTLDVGPKGAMDATVAGVLGASNPEIVVSTRDGMQIFAAARPWEYEMSEAREMDDIYSSGDIVVTDLDADGAKDLLLHGRYVIAGTGESLGEPQIVAYVGGFARPADVDGIEGLDLVYLGVTDLLNVRNLRVLHGFGDGMFDTQEGEPFFAQGCFSEPVTGDFNADGAIDFMVPTICADNQDGGGTLYFWLSCSDGSFVKSEVAHPDGVMRSRTGDFDGDGIADIALLGPRNLKDGAERPTTARVSLLLSGGR